jgi:hypothetical protein
MISKSEPTRSGTPQAQSIIVAAIILFAVSGLMVGFTVGAFVRPAKQPTNNGNQTNLATTTSTTTPTTPTAITTTNIPMAPPSLTLSPPDGTQTYSVTMQAVDKNDANKLITVDGITCRIWLVPQGNDPNPTPGTQLPNDLLQHPENFNQPFPQEVQNALIFNPPTVTETQPCVQGHAQWTFTISPSVAKGDYFLVGLTDWQGKNYNWRWVSLTVDGKKQGT